MAHVTFWFEFASTYSYLSAMRIEEMARKADVDVIWKPFLLGPIFKAQNWDTSPFNHVPGQRPLHGARYRAHCASSRLGVSAAQAFPSEWIACGASRACGSGGGVGTRIHPIRFQTGVRGATEYHRAIDARDRRLLLRGLRKTKPLRERNLRRSRGSSGRTRRRRKLKASLVLPVLQPNARSCFGATTGWNKLFCGAGV